MSMSEQEHDNNEFEKYPLLATWMERLANSNIEGMSLGEWSRFCEAVDSALRSASNEELIRGMTEMAERFTARMDGAAAQIDELRECLILAVKELDVLPVSIYSKGICERARKALGLQQEDRGHGI